ncbi:Dam family site-specific DNA-(adenine-N6)-methyltransferase [Mesorhizobium sp. WSM4312]|uniref:DNA adenine methylase n=1 Tax=Mesorhizobium sp. WSM4312 TaxID=2029411 RepID=UPI0015C9DB25|nr:Dam family site-specific DNA-(adenine-N6)-methyltransferase [Mesorhizobium sp. WSM4312]
MTRPLIRWAGSKRSVLGQIRPRMPINFSSYIEPFCGSAALSFEVSTKLIVLNDLNERLINFYVQCQSSPKDVYDQYSKFQATKEEYNRLRDIFNKTDDKLILASIFYFLNRNCFNGLYRTDKSGRFNVPFSSSRIGRPHTREEFLELAGRLKGYVLHSGDFELTVGRYLGSGSFFFIDPPYAVARRAPFTEYGPTTFKPKDISRLLGCLEAIDDSRGKFMLTYSSASGTTFRLRPTWELSEVSVQRHIAGFAGARRRANEILLTNYAQEQ